MKSYKTSPLGVHWSAPNIINLTFVLPFIIVRSVPSGEGGGCKYKGGWGCINIRIWPALFLGGTNLSFAPCIDPDGFR